MAHRVTWSAHTLLFNQGEKNPLILNESRWDEEGKNTSFISLHLGSNFETPNPPQVEILASDGSWAQYSVSVLTVDLEAFYNKQLRSQCGTWGCAQPEKKIINARCIDLTIIFYSKSTNKEHNQHTWGADIIFNNVLRWVKFLKWIIMCALIDVQ